MDPVITTKLGINLQVEWTAPDSGSEVIEAYKIEVLCSDLVYRELEGCDGSLATVLNNFFCTVPLFSLTEQPYLIQQDDLIEIRISAYNIIGFSVPSLLNVDGVRAINTPHKPTTAPLRSEGTSPYQLVVEYPNL